MFGAQTIFFPQTVGATFGRPFLPCANLREDNILPYELAEIRSLLRSTHKRYFLRKPVGATFGRPFLPCANLREDNILPYELAEIRSLLRSGRIFSANFYNGLFFCCKNGEIVV